MTKRVTRPKCVFLGLTEVSGYYANLKKGFTEIGVPTFYVDLSEHRFGYGGQSDHWTVHLTHRTAGYYRRFAHRRLAALAFRAANAVARLLVLMNAIATCDVFIFSYLSTFFRYRELPLLKLLGKRLIYVFHGSDSRAPYLDGYQQKGLSIADLAEATRVHKAHIRIAERYGYALVCTPIHLHLHERPVIGFQCLGVPVQYADDAVTVQQREQDADTVRILHAPTAPENKGTYRIRAVIDSLRQQGFRIEYVEMIGRPHAEVVAELKACDFVVDQINGEGPIGGFGTEAAYFGKPAVVGTHTDDIWKMYGEGDLPPIVRCDNDGLENAIRRLILDRDYRLDVGARAREFVRTRWTPAQVARNFVRLASGDAPPEWTFDPASLRYIYGAGLTVSKLRDVIANYVQEAGVDALHLEDKPDLQRRLLAFAAGGDE